MLVVCIATATGSGLAIENIGSEFGALWPMMATGYADNEAYGWRKLFWTTCVGGEGASVAAAPALLLAVHGVVEATDEEPASGACCEWETSLGSEAIMDPRLLRRDRTCGADICT